MQAALVRSILERWRAFEWTIQGFGFLRTKIADVGRIHVWDSRLATPLVSTAHTHPWPLRSTIISGELINLRFTEVKPTTRAHPGLPYLASKIATGEGGGLIGEPREAWLFPATCPEFVGPGDVYSQRPDEIHRTIAQDGTVTLLERPQGPPLQEADVYWPAGTQWVSAEPRLAEPAEISRVISYALSRWYHPRIGTP